MEGQRSDTQIHLANSRARHLVLSDKEVEESAAVGVFRNFLLRETNHAGLEISEEVKVNTPRRYTDAFQELMGLHDKPWEFTTFESEVDEMVLLKNHPFVSLCEHHLMPFTGVAHVAYLPQGKIAGLSKLARAVQQCSRGIWTQEHLTMAIANVIEEKLEPVQGVGVVLEAEHTCMSIRGVKSNGSSTTTSAMRGAFRDKPQARQEFLSLIK